MGSKKRIENTRAGWARFGCTAALAVFVATVFVATVFVATGTGVEGCVMAQMTGPSSASSSSNSASNSSSGSGLSSSTVIQAQQALTGLSGGSTSVGSSSSDFKGSVVHGTATNDVMQLSLNDAIERGLRTNLGVILQSSSEQNANGQRLEQLQALLPTVTGTAAISVEQLDLAAYGLRFPGLNPIVGPFQFQDFHASLSQTVLNVGSIQSYLAAKHSFQSAKLTAEDARDMVVLTVGNAYLLCIADQARVTAVEAELATSKVTLDQAISAHDAGTSPKLDVLRAQVDYQNEEQTLISTQNGLAKDKLSLARAIGLPLDQRYGLSDVAPFKAMDGLDPAVAFAQALKNRKDLAAMNESLLAAQAKKKAAWAGQLPQADISGEFGDQGTTVGHSHGIYTATGEVTVPILQIARTKGAEQVADSQYQQAKDRYADQIQQVNQDIRNSILDIQNAAKLVEATRSNVDLAKEALSEAQQRFHAGVSDNLPVSQAQAASEQANDQYISALYQHNVAKLSLARAMGVAQTSYQQYLGGK